MPPATPSSSTLGAALRGRRRWPPLAEWAKDGDWRLRHPRRTSACHRAVAGRRAQQRLDLKRSTADVVAGLRALIEGDVS
jgi:hypothetical protein